MLVDNYLRTSLLIPGFIMASPNYSALFHYSRWNEWMTDPQRAFVILQETKWNGILSKSWNPNPFLSEKSAVQQRKIWWDRRASFRKIPERALTCYYSSMLRIILTGTLIHQISIAPSANHSYYLKFICSPFPLLSSYSVSLAIWNSLNSFRELFDRKKKKKEDSFSSCFWPVPSLLILKFPVTLFHEKQL